MSYPIESIDGRYWVTQRWDGKWLLTFYSSDFSPPWRLGECATETDAIDAAASHTVSLWEN